MQQFQNIAGKAFDLVSRGMTQYETFGLVDQSNGETQIVNPLQTLYKVVDYARFGDDYSEKVWVGTKALPQAMGFNLEGLFINQWGVSIDGIVYQFIDDNGILKCEKTEDKEGWKWYRFGERKQSFEQIEDFIEYINNSNIKYNRFTDTWSYSDYLAKFSTQNDNVGLLKYFFNGGYGDNYKFNDNLTFKQFSQQLQTKRWQDKNNINEKTLQFQYDQINQQNYQQSKSLGLQQKSMLTMY